MKYSKETNNSCYSGEKKAYPFLVKKDLKKKNKISITKLKNKKKESIGILVYKWIISSSSILRTEKFIILILLSVFSCR